MMATRVNSRMDCPIWRCTLSMRLAPIAWLMVTVAPVVRPTMVTVTRWVIWLPVDTADTESAPLNLPTMSRSASS